ncbi:hypothetical protein DPMN_114986 [Dreissena polymorpha]|uniref:Uncharacterized protein n=1 Tax=Dreissena polymorpha TaxID=45954 RepID=A0A9D4KKW9_DREPO|nr:hypothetical protein DPMN_114986 [Dreissena polymorpha]
MFYNQPKPFSNLSQRSFGTNLLTKFHEDGTIIVASRVLTSPSPWLPCFSSNQNHFLIVQDIIRTNLLTKLHDDQAINVASRVLSRKNAPPPCGHVFQPTGIIFKLV